MSGSVIGALAMAQPPRSEDEIIRRKPITLVLGGREVGVRPRPIRRAEGWRQMVRKAFSERLANIESVDGLDMLMGGSPEALMDFVRAYDDEGQLPDREWIAENVTAEEAREAFGRLFDLEFPFFEITQALLPAGAPKLSRTLVMLVLESPPPTSEPSPNGASDPSTRSRKR